MTDLMALAEAVRQVLGEGIGAGAADPRAPSPSLLLPEKAATMRMRDKRYREFAAGRAAARAAMKYLRLPQAAVPMGTDRAPLWPPGLCGSIAHCDRAALAIVAVRKKVSGLGIDIEEDTDLPADLWADILTADERTWLHRQPRSEQGRRAKEIFCAKEAIHKLHHPLTGQMLGFHEVTLTLGRQSFSARLPVKASGLPEIVAGQILRTDGFVLAMLACSVSGSPSPELRPELENKKQRHTSLEGKTFPD